MRVQITRTFLFLLWLKLFLLTAYKNYRFVFCKNAVTACANQMLAASNNATCLLSHHLCRSYWLKGCCHRGQECWAAWLARPSAPPSSTCPLTFQSASWHLSEIGSLWLCHWSARGRGAGQHKNWIDKLSSLHNFSCRAHNVLLKTITRQRGITA